MSLNKERFTGFHDLELLAIFPIPTAAPDSFLTLESEGDLAEAARTANPLKREDMLRELDKYPLLGSMFRSQTFFVRFGEHAPTAIRGVFDIAAKLFSALIGPIWLLQLGLVSPREAAAGITAICGAILVNGSGVFLPGVGKARGILNKRMSSFDAHSFAGLVRWSSLLSGKGEMDAEGSKTSDVEQLGQRPNFPLVEHRDRDALCPCENNSCSGKLARSAGPLHLTDLFLRGAFGALFAITLSWTTLVYFSATSWTTWYSALGMTLMIISMFTYSISTYWNVVSQHF
jgi:hypothetical protein